MAIPLAIGVAVMRYRLYEIDRLVNRTLVYVTLTALLAATYAAVSLLLGVASAPARRCRPPPRRSPWRSRSGGCACACSAIVDRRFDRARYEGLRRVERHLVDLRAGRAAPEETGAVLAEALGDASLELLLWLPDSEEYVDASGRVVSPAEDGEGAR